MDLFEYQAKELFAAHGVPTQSGEVVTDAAAAAGAAGVLVERGREGLLHGIGAGTAAVAVADTLRALGDLARLWRSRFDIPVVAVTGSTGKTTTKEMAAAIMGQSSSMNSEKARLMYRMPQAEARRRPNAVRSHGGCNSYSNGGRKNQ